MVSHQLCQPTSVQSRSLLLGHIQHVRLEFATHTVDVLNCYQTVWHGHKSHGSPDKRSEFWQVLGHALSAIPARNVLLLVGDFNTGLDPIPSCIGRALHDVTKRAERDRHRFCALIECYQLCALNTYATQPCTFQASALRLILASLACHRPGVPPSRLGS